MTHRERITAALARPVPRPATITISVAGLIGLIATIARAMGPMFVTPDRFAHDSTRRETRYVIDSVKQLGRDSLLHRDISDVKGAVADIKADVQCLRHPKRTGCE